MKRRNLIKALGAATVVGSVSACKPKEQERVQKIQDRENCKIARQNKITLEKSVSVKKKNPAA